MSSSLPFKLLIFFGVHRMVLSSPKSIQATVTLLENLHVILEKTPQNDIRSEVKDQATFEIH